MKPVDMTVGKGIVALGLFLAGVTLLYADTNLPQPEAVAASGMAVDSPGPLAARFVETRREPNRKPFISDWYFVRSDARVETAQQDYAEVWERDERENLTLKRVFHGDRKVIEYTTGELLAQRRIRTWSALVTILDQRTLSRLEKGRATTALKQPAVRYAGRLGDELVEVVWLTRQAIPAKIERSNRGVTYTLELRDLRIEPDPSWLGAHHEQIDAYERLDAADLGDREYEPFVRKVLAVDAANGGFAHAH